MRVASVLGLDTELEAAWNCRRPVILGESGVWAGLDRDGEDYWLECASEFDPAVLREVLALFTFLGLEDMNDECPPEIVNGRMRHYFALAV